MENVSMKTKLEYGWVVENIKHLLNDWSQGKPLILLPDSKETKLPVSRGSSLQEICIDGNFEAGKPLNFAVMAVISQHLWATAHCYPLTF